MAQSIGKIALDHIINSYNIEDLLLELNGLCSCPLPTASDTYLEAQARIKKIELPSIRQTVDSLRALTSLTAEDLEKALLRFGHVHTIIEVSLSLLRLAFVNMNPRKLDRLVREMLPGLDIPAESLYAKVKLDRCANRLLPSRPRGYAFPWHATGLTDLPDQMLLDWSPEAFEEFTSDYKMQFTPRYLHVYEHGNDFPYQHMECEGKIGKGSYGTVTKVISTTSILTDREFALKTIDRVFFSPDREQVLAELAVLEACDHPNLIRLIDAYEIEGDSTKIYFVFEPWAPYTLESFLYTKDSQRWEGCGWFKPNDIASDQVIFRIMRNLADAVQHLHQHFIKHKDIKAQNTLLYNEGSVNIRVILTDMGKGKIHKKDATTNYIDSTIAFLAPEQIDEAESSLQADVWQLGCCFAQLLVLSCGGTDATHALWKSYSDTLEDRSCCVALELDNFMATLEKICGSQPIALGIVKGMLKKDPNTRSDIYQVLCALKSVVS